MSLKKNFIALNILLFLTATQAQPDLSGERAEGSRTAKGAPAKNARVRISNAPSAQEQEYRRKRKLITQRAIEKLVGHTIAEEEMPVIAFGFSGGGYRAMNATLGWLGGAESIGLLDAVTYLSSISGSTWFIAPWMASKKSIASYKADFIQKAHCLSEIDHLYKGDRLAPPFDALLKRQLNKKIKYGLEIGLIDIYSIVLGQSLLCNYEDPELVTISSSRKQVATGAWPLPLYTCTAPADNPHLWIDISPFEVNLEQFSIPTWAFGQKFENGKAVTRTPEQPLTYYLSICGSLFSTSPEKFLKTAAAVANERVRSKLELAAQQEKSPRGVKLRGILPNFTYGLPDTPYKDQNMELLDAGLFLNLPLASFAKMSRNPDIIIFCDSNIKEGTAFLQSTEHYARERGVPFPAIQYEAINNVATLFADKDNLQAPIVIYMPLRKNNAYRENFDPETSAYTQTYNFSYTPEQVEELSGLSAFNVTSSKDLFVQAINMATERRAKKIMMRADATNP